jgi:hypothetical protein
VGLIALALVASLVAAQGASTADANDTAAVVYQLQSAIDSGQADQAAHLFTPETYITDAAVYAGPEAAADWAQVLITDNAWLEITDNPDVSLSSGQPLPGYWALVRVTVSRDQYRQLAVDPMEATLAMIVQDGQIAYLSLRPDALWQRAYQRAKAVSLSATGP